MTEVVSNGFKTVFVFLLSLISILFGIMVVITNNPVVSVLFLIGLFFTISIYLIMLGLQFIGISYLLVYVGAISILFLFILMLINVRVSELLTEGINSMPLAVIAVITLSFNFNNVLPEYINTSDIFSNYLTYISKGILNLFSSGMDSSMNKLALIYLAIIEAANVNSTSWDGFLVEINHISSIGNILYSNLFILLIIVSLVLLLAMVGTIVITLKRETSLKEYVLTSSLDLSSFSDLWDALLAYNDSLDLSIPRSMRHYIGQTANGPLFDTPDLRYQHWIESQTGHNPQLIAPSIRWIPSIGDTISNTAWMESTNSFNLNKLFYQP